MIEDENNDSIEDEEEGAGWMTTFADMSMLLLVFFVLLYSMSSLDLQKFDESFYAVRRALNDFTGGALSSRSFENQRGGVFINSPISQRQYVKQQGQVFSDFKMFHTEHGMEGLVGANLESGTINLRVPSSVLFSRGQVGLTSQGRKLLATMKDFFIRHHDQRINIRGYTDNSKPAPGSRFRDNWEVSAMRAVNVLRYLITLGVEPSRLTATGFADLRPLYPNNSARNRARNRRVEFVLEKMIGGQGE